MSRTFKETRIDGTRVYDGKIVRLEVDRVRRPDGSEGTREVIRHQGASVMLPVLSDGRLVFVRQYRYATGRALLELPAGKIDPGETPEETAHRELEEETGYRAGAMHRLGEFFTTPGFTDERLHAFAAHDLVSVGASGGEGEEAIEIVTLTASEVVRSVRGGELRDAKSLATLLLAAAAGRLSLPFAEPSRGPVRGAPGSARRDGV